MLTIVLTYLQNYLNKVLNSLNELLLYENFTNCKVYTFKKVVSSFPPFPFKVIFFLSYHFISTFRVF